MLSPKLFRILLAAIALLLTQNVFDLRIDSAQNKGKPQMLTLPKFRIFRIFFIFIYEHRPQQTRTVSDVQSYFTNIVVYDATKGFTLYLHSVNCLTSTCTIPLHVYKSCTLAMCDSVVFSLAVKCIQLNNFELARTSLRAYFARHRCSCVTYN